MADVSAVEIVLSPEQQIVRVTLLQVTYTFTILWREGAGWVLDISDAEGLTPILQGVVLISGADLLAQHQHLGLGGALYVLPDTPTYENLGITSKLYFVP